MAKALGWRLIRAATGTPTSTEGCPVDGRRALAASVYSNLAIQVADRMTDIAMDALTVCPACGYPKFGPGLCAYCRPERAL